MQILTLRKRLLAAARYLPAAAVLVGVVVAQGFALPGNDVAWLLTLAEKYLAGARPDIDFIEFNPPAAYLIYVPAAAIARAIGIKSDLVLIALTTAAAAGSICAAGAIVSRAGLLDARDRAVMTTGAFVALLLFADSSFAQREHLAVIALLPMLAVYASRNAVAAPGNMVAILSGIAGGLAICIKPYFGFALALPLAYCVWRSKGGARGVLQLLFSTENISAAIVIALYLTAVALFFENYVQKTLPIVFAVYLPVRAPLITILTDVPFVSFLLMLGAGAVVGARDLARPIPAVLYLAAAGFLLATFVQARPWFYQGYPALVLLMIATVWLALQRATRLRETSGTEKLVSALVVTVGLVPSIAAIVTSNLSWYAETASRIRLTEGIRPIVPAHPKVIAISRRYAFAPVARRLGGSYVGRTYFQIITLNVDEQLAGKKVDRPTRNNLDAYARYDADILASDIRSKRPDVILVDGPNDRSWALSQPPVLDAFRGYREVGFVERAFVWVPK